MLTLRPIKTRSRFGSGALLLNLASIRNSPDRSTKSTRSHLNVLPQLVNTGFQVLFHSPSRGPFFTFPSQYYALSVTKEYLALGGWSPRLPARFHVSRGTLDPTSWQLFSCTGLSPSLVGFSKPFHNPSLSLTLPCCSPTPECTHSGLGSSEFRSPLLSESMFLSLPPLLRCFSSGVPDLYLCIQYRTTEVCSARFPHSEICGSLNIRRLIAAYHVFHRLSVPRHPPCALSNLTLQHT